MGSRNVGWVFNWTFIRYNFIASWHAGPRYRCFALHFHVFAQSSILPNDSIFRKKLWESRYGEIAQAIALWIDPIPQFSQRVRLVLKFNVTLFKDFSRISTKYFMNFPSFFHESSTIYSQLVFIELFSCLVGLACTVFHLNLVSYLKLFFAKKIHFFNQAFF